MKRALLLTGMLIWSGICFSQQVTLPLKQYDSLKAQSQVLNDSIDKLQKNHARLDSTSRATIRGMELSVNSLNDTIKKLRAELARLTKFKAEKNLVEAQLKRKSDSIAALKDTIARRNEQIGIATREGEQKAKAERTIGRNEALSKLVRMYQRPFDTLLASSTKRSVERDLRLIGDIIDAPTRQVLSDLLLFYSAKESLSKKFDPVSNQILTRQLSAGQHEASVFTSLQESLRSFKPNSDALKETVNKIIRLDQVTLAAGDPEIKRLKYNEILAELTDYMYNYYEFGNYPYLSEIVLEIIKRKKLNPDEDITDLLNRF